MTFPEAFPVRCFLFVLLPTFSAEQQHFWGEKFLAQKFHGLFSETNLVGKEIFSAFDFFCSTIVRRLNRFFFVSFLTFLFVLSSSYARLRKLVSFRCRDYGFAVSHEDKCYHESYVLSFPPRKRVA